MLGMSLVGCCENEWKHPNEIQLDTDADLNAVAGKFGQYIFATSDGQLISGGTVEYAGTVPLNAIATGGYLLDDDRGYWAVGDEGTFLRRTQLGTWEQIDLATNARLTDVLALDYSVVIVGDGVVRVWTGGPDWVAPPEPAGGWGELRAVFGDDERVWAVGADGVAWTTTYAEAGWTAEDTGLGEVNLNDGGWTGNDGQFVMVGDAGSMAYYDGVRWTPVRTHIDEDLVAYTQRVALARDGRLFFADDDGLDRVDKTEGLNRGLFHDGETEPTLFVVGEHGRARTFAVDRFCGF
jgi:photosystem II stability/assembly factor-like uncharacterized protein